MCVPFYSRRKSLRVNGHPTYHESDESNTSLPRRSATTSNRFKRHVATDGDGEITAITSSRPTSDDMWWRNYLNRKLDLDKEKMRQADEQHRDLIKMRKLEIFTKEKSDKLKIEAIQELTNAITKFIGTKSGENGLGSMDEVAT